MRGIEQFPLPAWGTRLCYGFYVHRYRGVQGCADALWVGDACCIARLGIYLALLKHMYNKIGECQTHARILNDFETKLENAKCILES